MRINIEDGVYHVISRGTKIGEAAEGANYPAVSKLLSRIRNANAIGCHIKSGAVKNRRISECL